jgi:phosphoglycolate phosphatase
LSFAAIFDLDGTILNTLPDLGNSLNTALSLSGYPTHTLVEYKTMVGNGMGKLVQRSLPPDKQTPEIIDEIRTLFKGEYKKHQCDLTKPYQGIEELLSKLIELKWPLGVLSNKDHENTTIIINHFFPNQFKIILGVSPDRPPKPELVGAREAALALGVPAGNIFYLGDSDVDMFTALNAGFKPFGVSWGFRPAAELTKAGALTILEHPMDFFKIVSEFCAETSI